MSSAPPPKATTAYFLFASDQRPQLKAAQPHLKVTEVAKHIGELWKALSAEDKAVREGARLGWHSMRGCEARAQTTPSPTLHLQVYDARSKAQTEAWKAYVAAQPAPSPAEGASEDELGGGGGAGGEDAGATSLPISRVKRIIKLDPSVGNVGREAGFLITVATEMFLEALGAQALEVAKVRRVGACRRRW